MKTYHRDTQSALWMAFWCLVLTIKDPDILDMFISFLQSLITLIGE